MMENTLHVRLRKQHLMKIFLLISIIGIVQQVPRVELLAPKSRSSRLAFVFVFVLAVPSIMSDFPHLTM